MAFKVFLRLFGCPKQNINHSSEKLMVIYIRRCLFYARINYQYKTSELKNVEKLLSKQVLLEWTGNVHFFSICEISFPVGGPCKSNVVLEKSLKNGCNFFWMNPVIRLNFSLFPLSPSSNSMNN